MKRIFTQCLILFALGAYSPIVAHAESLSEMMDPYYQQINISIQGNVLHVTGASDEIMFIYNVTGVRVLSQRIEGNDKRISLSLPKGCYIVKVGNCVRKIALS